MTTVRDILTDALEEIGVVAVGQPAQAEDVARALRVLNRRLQTWSQRRLLLPVLVEVSVPLTGQASYTIGPSGAVVAARPIKVVHATATDASGYEYPVDVLNQFGWDAIAVKNSAGGPPSDVWYEAANTNGRVHVYPKASGYTLQLDCHAVLATYTDVNATVVLPDGYEDAMVLDLADALCTSFGKACPPDLLRRATAAMRAVKTANAEPLLLEVDGAAAHEYMIERGY